MKYEQGSWTDKAVDASLYGGAATGASLGGYTLVDYLKRRGIEQADTAKKAITHVPKLKATDVKRLKPLGTKFLSKKPIAIAGAAGLGIAGIAALTKFLGQSDRVQKSTSISNKIDSAVDTATGVVTAGGTALTAGALSNALLHKKIGKSVRQDEIKVAVEVLQDAAKKPTAEMLDFANTLPTDNPVRKLLLTGDAKGLNLSDPKIMDTLQDAFVSVFHKSSENAPSLLKNVDTSIMGHAKRGFKGFKKGLNQVPSRFSYGAAGLGALMAAGGYGTKRLSENMQKTSTDNEEEKRMSSLNRILAGTAAGVVGTAGLVGALSMGSRLKSLKKLSGLIRKMEINKGLEKADPHKMIGVFDEYAPVVQDLMGTNFSGVPADQLMTKFPPSYVFSPDPETGKLDLWGKVKKLINKNSMTPEEALEFSRTRSHYASVKRDPYRTMVSEILTEDVPDGSFQDLRPSLFSAEGKPVISQKEFDTILRREGTVADKLKGFEDRVAPALRDRFGIFYDDNKGIAIKGYEALGSHVKNFGLPASAVAGVGGLGTAGTLAYGGLSKESAESVTMRDVFKTIGDRRIKGLDVKGGVTLEDLSKELLGHKPTGTVSKDSPSYRLFPLALGVGGTSMLGALTSLYSAQKYRKDKGGKDAIALTGGAFDKPYTAVDIGAGHKTPAIAAKEALMAHPDAGDFDINAVIATNKPGTAKLELRDELGKLVPAKRYTASVDTRFGINNLLPFQGGGTKTNPYGRATFHADPVAGDLGPMSMLFQGQKYPYQKMKVFTYGPEEGGRQGTYERLRNFPEAHPLMKDSVLNAAQDMLDRPVEKNAFLQDMSQRLLKEGDKPNALKIQKARQRGKKILTISGSSRGDSVAINAKHVSDQLKAAGRDDVIIIAQMAKGADTPSASLIKGDPNIIMTRFIEDDPRYLLGMQNIADLHLASTGASASAEAMASPTPVAVMTNYAGTRDKEIAAIRKYYITDLEHKHKQGSITSAVYGKSMGDVEEHIDSMRRVQLDLWNEGTQNWFKKMEADKVPGIFTIDRPDAILDRLDSVANIPGDERALFNKQLAKRGKDYIDNARVYKRTFADEVIKLAKGARGQGDVAIRNRYALAGILATIGIAAPITALHYITGKLKKAKEKNMNKKSAEELGINPLQAILQQGAVTPERPGDPSLNAPMAGVVEEEGPADTRKLTISDKGMDGNEIKMSVESSKEDDDRINFLLNAFTEKTDEPKALGDETPAEEIISEPAEVAGQLPAQVVPAI